ncbi:MAG: acetoin dehydrogenase dihydrolipoyllysine-residue acetyltransferase subunit [Alphaproteobacteria bacterium]|nr:acetoin dehydrogenase dihydrolipoyllysine-residue acetyltransferase subunit [Alphaproteobacteria bacterium]
MALFGVTVPKWGLAMEEGQLVHWYVEAGARVAAGDALVDIETPKITNTLEANDTGVVRRVLGKLGDTLPCGHLIAVIDDAEASEEAIEAFVAKTAAEVEERQQSAAAGHAEPQMVDAAGERVRYLAMGEGDAPVLFLHGFGGDLNNWMFNQPALSSGHRTISVDLPGHGGSSKNVADGSVASLATTVIAAMDALDLGSAHLVGHSLGGAVAMAIASAEPARALSLTLICSAGLGHEISRAYIEGFLQAKRRRDLQKVLELLFADKGLVTAEMAEDLLKFKRLDGAEDALRRIVAANFPDFVQHGDLRETLATLRVPLLTIWGKEDCIIPAAHATGLPGRVEILDGAGHMPHLEKVSDVNAMLSGHIEAAS